MEDMTIEFDDTTQCYKIPVTGSVGIFRATVTRLFKKDGLLHVTVGYIPTQSSDDSILNNSSDTPTKYMDYLFTPHSQNRLCEAFLNNMFVCYLLMVITSPIGSE